MQPVQASLQTAFKTLPTAELGILDRLPAELLSLVLRELGIRSFLRFRQVNRQSRIISTGLWEYELVFKHGLEGLRVLLLAELDDCFTIDKLYRPLITDKCSTCGLLGDLLFLFTAERFCFDCLQSLAHYRVVFPYVFTKLAGLSPARFESLLGPGLRTVPGIYNTEETQVNRPKYLMSEEEAIKTLLTVGAILEPRTRR
jgi:hypothetical protein